MVATFERAKGLDCHNGAKCLQHPLLREDAKGLMLSQLHPSPPFPIPVTGLCPGWRQGCQRTLALPRQILPCSMHISIAPSAARASTWKISVVLERGAASGAEQFNLGASWLVGTNPATCAVGLRWVPLSLACAQGPLLVLPCRTCRGFDGILVSFCPCPKF